MNYQFRYFLEKLPMVEVELSHGKNETTLIALIDTGADFTIFPREVADDLGISVEKGKLKILQGAGGNLVAYLHPVRIKLCDLNLPIIACFSEKNDVPEHILGRSDVLNHFKLILDRDQFELVPHQKLKSKGPWFRWKE